MSGRKPLPTNVLKMKGTYRANRHDKDEPDLTAKIPPCPKTLDDEEKKTWRWFAKQLKGLNTLTTVDQAVMTLLCRSWVIGEDAHEKIKEQGMVVNAPSGYPVQNPYLSIMNKAHEQVKSILVEIGATPAARRRVSSVAPKPKANPNDEFFD